MANPNPKSGVSKITSPKGTRDLYPEDALKRRYLEQCWRDASVRCGFEEIHGPTFETTDLYSVKSGEGILGELFQAYSGKAPEEVAQVQATGRAPYAMRPEFTPTLARMYAAKAGSLPKPCKWFTGGAVLPGRASAEGEAAGVSAVECGCDRAAGGSGDRGIDHRGHRGHRGEGLDGCGVR
jgi:histidyl-tRNA synthetase